MRFLAHIPTGARLRRLRTWARRATRSYLSPEEIADHMIAQMTEEQKNTWRWHVDTSTGKVRPLGESDVYAAHHGSGRTIRNEYGLWEPENPYTELNPKPNRHGIIDDPRFPDQVSHEIMKMVVMRLSPVRGKVPMSGVRR